MLTAAVLRAGRFASRAVGSQRKPAAAQRAVAHSTLHPLLQIAAQLQDAMPHDGQAGGDKVSRVTTSGGLAG